MSGLVVVDTSVWVAQFAGKGPDVTAQLDNEGVRLHEFIIGELVLGAVRRRHPIAAALLKVFRVSTLAHDEVVEFVRLHRLEGSGIGWVDAHILASTKVAGASLWTHDKCLLAAAAKAGVAT